MAAEFRSSKRGEIEEHVSIEVMPEENLMLSIKEKMEKVSISGSICRVPDELLKGNREKFLPKLVSIGPLHHGKIAQAMEDQKWRYLNAFLAQKSDIEKTLDACVKTLKNLEQKARKCYRENLDHIGSNEFVQMMLVDGCFIIELFLKFAVKSLRRRDDPWFTKTEQFFSLRCDLILLENQIPFFVLQQLFHLVPIPKRCSLSLIELALCFFRKWIPEDGEIPEEKYGPDVHHLLDLIRQCHLPAIAEVQSHGTQTYLPNATQLKAGGIDFDFCDPTKETLNIKFDDGILKIPPLKIHRHTEILFKNLVALEVCSFASPKHVTSYVFLMKQLIKTKDDVRMLHNRQILINGLEKQEEIIQLFESFLLDIKVEDFYYKWLCEKIDEHGNIKRQKNWRQKLKHFYAKTPFGVAGFSFAILVVVSIFTAALFSALAFFLHHVN